MISISAIFALVGLKSVVTGVAGGALLHWLGVAGTGATALKNMAAIRDVVHSVMHPPTQTMEADRNVPLVLPQASPAVQAATAAAVKATDVVTKAS